MPTDEAGADLAGVHVLVTRPAHQSAPLSTMIEQAGGKVTQVPVIEIVEAPDPEHIAGLLDRLAQFDLAVFVSANAVERTLALLEGRGGWPSGVRIAAVGRGSAVAVERHGLRVDICPRTTFDSEGLLDEPALAAVAGWRVVILRGEGGRGLIAETLRARGADVVYADVYRRRLPPGAAGLLRAAAMSSTIDIIVVTSNEGLQNLWQAAGAEWQAWLRQHQLVVISERAAVLAAGLGFARPAEVATEASDRGLLAAIRRVAMRQAHNGGARHVH